MGIEISIFRKLIAVPVWVGYGQNCLAAFLCFALSLRYPVTFSLSLRQYHGSALEIFPVPTPGFIMSVSKSPASNLIT